MIGLMHTEILFGRTITNKQHPPPRESPAGLSEGKLPTVTLQPHPGFCWARRSRESIFLGTFILGP